MKVEILPSLHTYESPVYPEDTAEEWGSIKKPKVINDESEEKKRVRFVYEDLRKQTLESLNTRVEENKEVVKKPQEALRYSFPILTFLIAIGGILLLILFLRCITK